MAVIEDVIATVEGAVGQIRLNRPEAINALTTAMCDSVLDALEKWRHDDGVRLILLDHAQGRGFCAGGDIRQLARSGADDGSMARRFFATEYRMNHRLFTYTKPIVAFMDGITMGGGVGISQPARFRVATENTLLAMPETGIGLFPDVGGGWYLSRLPGRFGQYLALTGSGLDGAEAFTLGLATHYLPAEHIVEAKARIVAQPEAAEAILDALSMPAPAGGIMAHQAVIDRLFASDKLETVFTALEADGGDWATQQLAVLKRKSPQTMKVSLRLLLDGAAMTTFADEMRQEYAVASRVVQRHDFLEGVRAVIADKDNTPRWNPATPEGVSDRDIDLIFAPLPDSEAWLP